MCNSTQFFIFHYVKVLLKHRPISCLNNDNIFNQDTQSSICLFRIGLKLKFILFFKQIFTQHRTYIHTYRENQNSVSSYCELNIRTRLL